MERNVIAALTLHHRVILTPFFENQFQNQNERTWNFVIPKDSFNWNCCGKHCSEFVVGFLSFFHARSKQKNGEKQ